MGVRGLKKMARLSFFSVRLWDANDLIEAIFKNYDRLPEELQSELPSQTHLGVGHRGVKKAQVLYGATLADPRKIAF